MLFVFMCVSNKLIDICLPNQVTYHSRDFCSLTTFCNHVDPPSQLQNTMKQMIQWIQPKTLVNMVCQEPQLQIGQDTVTFFNHTCSPDIGLIFVNSTIW